MNKIYKYKNKINNKKFILIIKGKFLQLVESFERLFCTIFIDFVIVIINIMSFGCYPFLVFSFIFWILVIIIIIEYKVFDKFGH